MTPDDLCSVSTFARMQGVADSTVRRWIGKKLIVSHEINGRLRISPSENIQFILVRLRETWSRPEPPWVPEDLSRYDDWHTVLDELVWLFKVSYSDRDSVKRRRFRLDHMFQQHLATNIQTLNHVGAAFTSASPAAGSLVQADLRRAWYNELAFAHPIRSATLGLSFRDVEANKRDAAERMMFPSWRFINAYYTIYFYVRCLCLMKSGSFRLEQHAATINTFNHSVLPAVEGSLWPWPLTIRDRPGRRVRRASLPIQQPHLRFEYARHPRSPHRSPLESYEYVRGQLAKRGRRGSRVRTYSVLDFLYDFRVWANYQDIDSFLALWGPGYRSFIDMNLSVLIFFVASSAELAFAAAVGEDVLRKQLQHLYDEFVSRDDLLRREFGRTPLYQRTIMYQHAGLVSAGVRLRTEANPHEVELLTLPR